MSYRHQTGSTSNHTITPIHGSPHSTRHEFKENIPLHSQIFQRLQASANIKNKLNVKKEMPCSNSSGNQVKGSQTMNLMKCLSPVKFSGFQLSKTFGRQEELASNQAPNLEVENKGGNNSNASQEITRENGIATQKKLYDEPIPEEIVDVDEHYKQLTQKISEVQNLNESSRALDTYKNKDENFFSNVKAGSFKMGHKGFSSFNEKETWGSQPNIKNKNLENRKGNELEKRKPDQFERGNFTTYPYKKSETGGKGKLKEQVLEKKSKDLMNLAEQLTRREDIIQEREKAFMANEKAFENLTKVLEDQSEELAKQKIDYNEKIEMFQLAIKQYENEKEEFAANIVQKNIELKADGDRLQNIRNEIQREQNMLDEKCREILKGYNDLNVKKALLEKKEEEILRREKALKEESNNLQIEKAGFSKARGLAEKDFKAKEEQLLQWEQSLEARKIAYDEYDLKLMSMKLNEEVWQKKRNIEVVTLQEKIRSVQNKENELQRKEEKLNKMMEQVRKGRESIKKEFESKAALDPEQSDTLVEDTVLTPITSRMVNVEDARGYEINRDHSQLKKLQHK